MLLQIQGDVSRRGDEKPCVCIGSTKMRVGGLESHGSQADRWKACRGVRIHVHSHATGSRTNLELICWRRTITHRQSSEAGKLTDMSEKHTYTQGNPNYSRIPENMSGCIRNFKNEPKMPYLLGGRARSCMEEPETCRNATYVRMHGYNNQPS